jgi:membrane-associated phospholipid phosphatase
VLSSVREQARPEGLLTLLAAGAAAGAVHASDGSIQDSLQRSTPLGRRATDAGALIGNYALLLPAAGAGYLVGGLANASRAQEASLMTLEALTVAGVETEALKLAVRRERPDRSDRYSFPSGHASGSFAAATVAASEYGWKAGVPAFLVAGFVGYTRMEKNKHHLSDVLFGAGLGVSAGRAVYKTHRASHPERFAVVPYAAPGGGGVIVLF